MSAAAAANTTPGERVFAFAAEYHDPASDLTRRMHIAWFEADRTVEIFDARAKRTFLKRIAPREKISADDFTVGNTVTVFARPYKIIEYLNAVTRECFSTTRTVTCCIIKPDALPHAGRLLDRIVEGGLTVSRMRMVRLSRDQAAHALLAHRSRPTYADDVAHLSADAVIVVEVAGPDCVAAMHGIAGPTDPADAAAAAPDSIRCVPRNALIESQGVRGGPRNARALLAAAAAALPTPRTLPALPLRNAARASALTGSEMPCSARQQPRMPHSRWTSSSGRSAARRRCSGIAAPA